MASARSLHLRAVLACGLLLCCAAPAWSDFTQQDSPLRGQGCGPADLVHNVLRILSMFYDGMQTASHAQLV
jgi:hypothetical protein